MASSSSSSSSSHREKSNDAILDASSTGNLTLVKQLGDEHVNDGAGRNLMEVKNSDGRCALHLAASGGHTQVCEHLIEQLKFDINVKDNLGNSPLHIGVSREHYSTCVYLLEQGAQPSMGNNQGLTPLHYASKKGKIELMELLISKGAEVDALSSKGTPLHSASSTGQKDAVKILLDNHANPNLEFHLPPLMVAIMEKSIDCVRILLEGGADPNSYSLGASPLIMAIFRGDTEMIKCLLEAGADPNVTDIYGVTPIEHAARVGSVADVESLFQGTTRIERIPNWSCDGIIEYVNSDEAKKQYKLKAKEKFAEAKEKAAEAFRNKEYYVASLWYTHAINARPMDAVMLSNRSLCYANLNDGDRALKDAVFCIALRMDWPKAYYRAGVAFRMLGKKNMAADSFAMGLFLDPENKELQDASREVMEEVERELEGESASHFRDEGEGDDDNRYVNNSDNDDDDDDNMGNFSKLSVVD